MAKLLIVIGVAVVAAGVAMYLGLPGDIVVRRGACSFYFPLTTSVLVSVVLTLLFALVRR